MGVRQIARAQRFPIRAKDTPSICIMLPTAVVMADGYVKLPKFTKLLNRDIHNRRRIGQGRRGKSQRGEDEAAFEHVGPPKITD